MPGVFGLIHRYEAFTSIAESLDKLMHFPTYCSQEIKLRNGIHLGQVWRHKKFQREEWYYDETSKSGVLLNGSMFLSAPHPHRVSPQELLDSYHQNGFSRWHEYDGTFIAVVIDLRKQKIFIGNDRLGMLPLYFSQTKDMFCFGPEVKAVLTGLRKDPKFSKPGLVSFLAAGHCLGDTTLFEGVQYLRPSSLLTLNLDTFTLERTQLWNLHYDSHDKFQNKRIAREALYAAIKDAHNLVLCDNPQRFDLLLSGGLDSRGILGVLEQLGKLPARALSWGLREDIPYSDAKIAHLMADEFKIPFNFKAYTSDEIPQNAENWCYLSELANDNLGWYSEGVGVLLNFYDVTADFSLKGDECWGWGGWCHAKSEAISMSFPFSLPPALHSILRKDYVKELEELYDQEIRSITPNDTFQNWTDFKDYLYLYGRVVRFIFSMGYYQELATEIRRPFLANGVLEVMRRLPAKFRIHKNLYVDILKHYLPRTMVVPDKFVSSLPDLPYDVRATPRLRQFFLGLCNIDGIENGVLGELISVENFSKVRDGFWREDPHPIRRTISFLERKQKAWKMTIASTEIWGELKQQRPPYEPVSSFNAFPILNRIALIVLLEKQLAKFSH
ncbi:MAG: asparagine synthase-related protein [Nitrospirales bacterium]|nr:asparagine synthase-related protein [Nitrospirales bacterium]